MLPKILSYSIYVNIVANITDILDIVQNRGKQWSFKKECNATLGRLRVLVIYPIWEL